jgi:hypothetical protein
MDNDFRVYLEAMDGRIMAKINDGLERVVSRLSSPERHFTNPKGFLAENFVSSRHCATWMAA